MAWNSKVTTRLVVIAASFLLAACVSPIHQDSGRSVTIKRDGFGVPHIYASSVRGLYFGMGYALAEDRLFQMEMTRRSFTGTVAEALGPGESDKWIKFDQGARSAFTPASIRRQLAALKAEDRDIFEGYASGFNARVAEVLKDRQLLPKQFRHYGFDPGQWTAYDVVMVFVGSAYRYSEYNSEITNQQLLQSLVNMKGPVVGRQVFEQLRWTNDPTAPTTVGDDPVTRAASGTGRTESEHASAQQARAHDSRLADAFWQLTPLSGEALAASVPGDIGPLGAPTASNFWVVAPAKSADGRVHLNNGPQFGNYNPGYTWGVGLHGAGFDVVGNTTAGSANVHFATNGKIAWGSTAGAGDSVDTYQLDLNPINADQYMFNGAYKDFLKRTEVIKVKGRPDAAVEIRASVHGNVSFRDPARNLAYARKRIWEGDEVDTLLGLIESMKAQNWTEFLAANKRVALGVSRYYADTSGNIGYVLTGKYPQRPASQDFRLPPKGDGSMEWLGFQPLEANPQVYNPPQGFIVNWNNKPSAAFQNTDNFYFSSADRIAEFIQLMQSKSKFTSQEVREMNRVTSYKELHVRHVLPHLRSAVAALPPGDRVRAAVASIDAWDHMLTDSAQTGRYPYQYTIFNEFLVDLMAAVFKDDLPPALFSQVAGLTPPTATRNLSPGFKALVHTLQGGGSGVAQTYDFLNGEDKGALIRRTMLQTLDRLAVKYQTQEFGKWLVPTSRHTFLTENFIGVPQALPEELLEFTPLMNRGAENNHISLGATGVESCDVTSPGQGGGITADGKRAAHYSDQMQIYIDFSCKRQWTRQADIDANTVSTKQLRF